LGLIGQRWRRGRQLGLGHQFRLRIELVVCVVVHENVAGEAMAYVHAPVGIALILGLHLDGLGLHLLLRLGLLVPPVFVLGHGHQTV